MEWAWSYHDGNRDGDAGDGDGGSDEEDAVVCRPPLMPLVS